MRKQPKAKPIVNSNNAAPIIPVNPNSNSFGLSIITPIILVAIKEIEEPKARIVEPANLSEI